MWNKLFKINIIAALLFGTLYEAQMFRNKNRMDNLEGFDNQKFSYGFFLAGNNFDYKLVLDPTFGMDGNKSLVQSKPTYSFGAGLIGKFRLSENFDLRIEPGLQFVERELYFDTKSNNDQYAAGTPANPAFTPVTLSDADKLRKIKSTYVDIPILLEVHGDRWYNSRPYAAAGVNYMLNLQSNTNSEDDNQQGIFRTTSGNFAWSAEVGIQFYFSRFKLTPGFRGTFMVNNELVADNPTTPPYWTDALASVKTRALMFVLKFE
ncbi:probable protein-translocating porin PorT [Kaistella treverensis]|uniref:Probable protein-translocating porin PorT n=1 Tax=Kaistella treverensis TaxID=631455 RepID=A0A1I3KR41_9FLAO|nr:porin family protein [Kaistella treverensis]SFI74575.1 probable protein-translocating porin PorT [Kaistella treverensis]